MKSDQKRRNVAISGGVGFVLILVGAWLAHSRAALIIALVLGVLLSILLILSGKPRKR